MSSTRTPGPTPCRRGTVRAFTLVELLVVIAIIGLLVILLLPAVNGAREAARNTQCKNNIRQVAMAVVNYEGLHGHFPVSETTSGASRGSNGCEAGHYSWHARILPHLEEQQLFQRIDFTVDMADDCNDGEAGQVSSVHRNAEAAATIVDAFLCPSDGNPGVVSDLMGTAHPAPDNYAGNTGWPALATGYNGERETPHAANGLIIAVSDRIKNAWQMRGPVRAKHVKDGLSKTALVAERLVQHGTTRDQILEGSEKTKSYHLTEHARSLSQMVARCNPQETHADLHNSAYLGRAWISGWTPTASTYMHVMPPNTHHCHFSHSLKTGDFIVTSTSNHAGGVNVAFADGHVTFIPDDVDPQIWWAIGSRNGNDQTGEM